MLSAFLASIGVFGANILDKIILDEKKYSLKKFLIVTFVMLAVFTLVIIPFTFKFDIANFNVNYLLLFILMLALAIGWNVPYYTSIKKESLHEFELIMLLTPLTTVILASIFIPQERNLGLFLAIIAASGALVLSRYRPTKGFYLTQNVKRTFLAMILMAAEAVVIKFLLDIFSPSVLYFTRTLFIAIIFAIIYRKSAPSASEDKNLLLLIAASALFGVLQMVAKFYGFSAIGVVKTTLIMLIGPVLTYLASFFYFEEKRNFLRNVLAGAVVLACVAYATIF